MTVSKRRDGKKLTIAIEGRLDTLTAPDFEVALIPELNGIETLVFDLRDLAYISSAGLRVMLQAAQIMSEQDGEIKTLGANKNVKNIFSITGLIDALGVE
jgi:anti-sigma B factor antagonist